MLVTLKLPIVEPVKAAPLSGNPKVPLPVFENGSNHVAPQAKRVSGVVIIVRERFGLMVVSVQAGRIRSDPQVPIQVFIHGADDIVTQAAGILGLVLVHFECVAVISIQPVGGTNPYETATILYKTEHPVTGKPWFVVRWSNLTLEAASLPPCA